MSQRRVAAGVVLVAGASFIVLAAALSHHRMRDYLTSAPQFRWRLLAAGMVMSMLAIGPLLGVKPNSYQENRIRSMAVIVPAATGPVLMKRPVKVSV